MRAKERATIGPAIFSGEMALKEVAKKDGAWNWALVGPDPSLPLSGGGSGGVEEMRASVNNHPHSVGLLRYTFGDGIGGRMVLIAIHTSCVEGFNIKERNRAKEKAEQVQQSLERFGKLSAKIRIINEEECTLDFVIDKLRSMTIWGVEPRSIRADNVYEQQSSEDLDANRENKLVMGPLGLQTQKYKFKKPPKLDKFEEEGEQEADGPAPGLGGDTQQCEGELPGDDEEEDPIGCLLRAPKSFLSGMTPPKQDEDEEEEETDDIPMAPYSSVLDAALPAQQSRGLEDIAQRKKVKRFRPGDQVEVWSIKYDRWIGDAEIVEVLTESAIRDGNNIRAGSVKVLYKNKGRFKWIPPQLVDEVLRVSGRPPVPDPKIGELLKEIHTDVTEWCPVHVEVNEGFIQWWIDEEAARRGEQPQGIAYLFMLQMFNEGLQIKLRTDSTQGGVHAFKAESEEEVQIWVEALWEHAGHCGDMMEHAANRRAMLKSLNAPAAAEGRASAASLASTALC